jgi:hypothetical protein
MAKKLRKKEQRDQYHKELKTGPKSTKGKKKTGTRKGK